MKIFLSRNDVQKLVCNHLDLSTITLKDGRVILTKDEVYWEGNPKPKEVKEGERELKS